MSLAGEAHRVRLSLGLPPRRRRTHGLVLTAGALAVAAVTALFFAWNALHSPPPRREESAGRLGDAKPGPVAPPVAATAAQPGARTVPFILEHHLHVRRIVHDTSIALPDVVSGQTVLVGGDRLQLSIRTSQNGYLYLAFCSQRDIRSRYHGLSVFPAHGSLRLTANVTHSVPSLPDELVLDDQPGPQTIFVVVSKSERFRLDSALNDILDVARRDSMFAKCMINGGIDIEHSPDLVDANDGAANPLTNSTAAQGQDVDNQRAEGTPRGGDADVDEVIVIHYQFKTVTRRAERPRPAASIER